MVVGSEFETTLLQLSLLCLFLCIGVLSICLSAPYGRDCHDVAVRGKSWWMAIFKVLLLGCCIHEFPIHGISHPVGRLVVAGSEFEMMCHGRPRRFQIVRVSPVGPQEVDDLADRCAYAVRYFMCAFAFLHVHRLGYSTTHAHVHIRRTHTHIRTRTHRCTRAGPHLSSTSDGSNF